MKKIMLISSVILTIIVMSIITINNIDKNEKNIIKNKEEKEIIKSNMLTLMYETEAGSKEYEESKDNTWPEEGYIFNKTLSGCENGGELEYNSQNNTVNLLTNKSDKCYVYFDKYNGVWIDNVVATNITGSSITIDISATSENGSISKYYYQVNESGYIESTNNIITIEDLNKLTEYKIEVYAVDSTNAKSNIYELNVSTTDISIPTINNVSVSNITTTGFTLTVNATSEYEISKYYFIIDGSGEQIAGTSTTNKYTFTTLEDETNYNMIIFVKDINGNISNEYSINIMTDSVPTLVDYIKGLYTSQGSNGIYYHTSSLANSAADNSYRYAGANPNNYVCFGSDAGICPNNNLYRIIGIFNGEVKIIKSTSYGNYVWYSKTGNTWSTSSIRTILNSSFLSTISDIWQDKIITHTWNVGGINDQQMYIYTAKQYYDFEVGSSSSSTTDRMKIGLMYVSDYGYAASNNYWTTTLYGYSSAKSSNWLAGLTEWTISRVSSFSNFAFNIESDGIVETDYVSGGKAVRPCFYLASSTFYISGSGTIGDPIRIN